MDRPDLAQMTMLKWCQVLGEYLVNVQISMDFYFYVTLYLYSMTFPEANILIWDLIVIFYF